MNNRIQQLALQAGLKQRIWNSLGKELPIWQEDPDNPGLEKFAKLIVEEMYCFMVDATDNDKPWPSFKEVKLHFGVEE